MLFGISRQALHKQRKAESKKQDHSKQICAMVKTVRQLMPRSGTRKLHDLMSYALKERGISIGRDRLFETLKHAQLLVPRRKKHFFTTDSKHRFYKHPYKAKDLNINAPEQLWVSDITYLKSKTGNLYLSLVTDAFSRKIMGYHIADHLKATGPVEALKMAITNRKYPHRKLMHHSDKGIQYCCEAYINMLTENNIDISMTSKYDPYENAKAERINSTIKNEFELDAILPDLKYAKREIAKTVKIYNALRPHLSCNMNTPDAVHNHKYPDPIKQKNKEIWKDIILNNFNLN